MIKNLFKVKKGKAKNNRIPMKSSHAKNYSMDNMSRAGSSKKTEIHFFNQKHQLKTKNSKSVALMMRESQLNHAIWQDSFHLKGKIYDNLGVSRYGLLKSKYFQMRSRSGNFKSSDLWANKYLKKVWKRGDLNRDFKNIRKEKLEFLTETFKKSITLQHESLEDLSQLSKALNPKPPKKKNFGTNSRMRNKLRKMIYRKSIVGKQHLQNLKLKSDSSSSSDEIVKNIMDQGKNFGLRKKRMEQKSLGSLNNSNCTKPNFIFLSSDDENGEKEKQKLPKITKQLRTSMAKNSLEKANIKSFLEMIKNLNLKTTKYTEENEVQKEDSISKDKKQSNYAIIVTQVTEGKKQDMEKKKSSRVNHFRKPEASHILKKSKKSTEKSESKFRSPFNIKKRLNFQSSPFQPQSTQKKLREDPSIENFQNIIDDHVGREKKTSGSPSKLKNITKNKLSLALKKFYASRKHLRKPKSKVFFKLFSNFNLIQIGEINKELFKQSKHLIDMTSKYKLGLSQTALLPSIPNSEENNYSESHKDKSLKKNYSGYLKKYKYFKSQKKDISGYELNRSMTTNVKKRDFSYTRPSLARKFDMVEIHEAMQGGDTFDLGKPYKTTIDQLVGQFERRKKFKKMIAKAGLPSIIDD